MAIDIANPMAYSGRKVVMGKARRFMAILFLVVLTACVPFASRASTATQPRGALDTPAFATAPPSQAPSATLVPTLSPVGARAYLIDLLLNNDHCRLPCLWGIAPGYSTLDGAFTILSPLSSLSGLTFLGANPGGISPRIVLEDIEVHVNLRLLSSTNNSVVDFIDFSVRALKPTPSGFAEDFYSSAFRDLTQHYSLSSILAEYGPPSDVRLFTYAETPPPSAGLKGNFQLLLLYPELGFLVQYTTTMAIIEGSVVGCFDAPHVAFALTTPGTNNLYEFIPSTTWQITIQSYQALEQVTTLSIDDFYLQFRNPLNDCLETPAYYWP